MTEQTKKRLIKGKALGGRPSVIDRIDKDQIKFLAQKGFTDQDLCDFYAIDKSTYDRWKQKYPKFFGTVKDWKEVADRSVERSLFERAKGYNCKATKFFMYEGEIIAKDYIEHHPPDPTSCIFWLKNRKPEQWRDKREVGVSGEVGLKAINSLADGYKKTTPIDVAHTVKHAIA